MTQYIPITKILKNKCIKFLTAEDNISEVIFYMPKDSQIDSKDTRSNKSNGGPTSAQSALDGEGRNAKKQSAGQNKANDDKKSG